MYYPSMASLIHKLKKGHLYTYWVESKRVNGKPRIVEQVYLGPRDRVLDEIKRAYTRGSAPGPTPLRRLQHREFGASAWLWHWADRLGLARLIDAHVPPVEAKRRTQLSVGQYLVLAAINRVIDPRSKRAFYEYWYQDSVLARLCPAKEGELTSQRFWDHMNQVQPEHLESIQKDLVARLGELFALGEDTILYDATNYFTFIDTFNQRSELAQRGWNKQKRTDLRQLSLALFEDERTGLPLYHQCYAGDRPDVSQFETAWQAMVKTWVGGLRRRPEQLTLVFDKGNGSKENLARLEDGKVRYVGAIPGHWVPELLEVGLADFRKLELPGSRHVKGCRVRREFWGKLRTLLVVFSPSFYRKQRAVMNRQQAKVEGRLVELAQAIDQWTKTHHGKGYSEESVRRQIGEWTGRDHLREYFAMDLSTDQKGKVIGLTWTWDRSRKRTVQRTYLGKTVLVTDHDDWDDPQIVMAYRKLWKAERLFRISKDGPWWPMCHWTDSKVRVHAFYCYLALLLLAILQRQLQGAGLTLSVDRCIDRLKALQETLVIYTNGASERLLSDRDPLQEQLFQALGLGPIAEQLGTTALPSA
ncbi:MAG: IS1634 family transposase [Acidobacteria bacterium]|nr:MAG: IS1634 family transposase [Acidobacteriota bacterium]